MARINRLSFLNLCATLFTILINGLSNTSILGVKNVGEISDSYPTLFTPPGYVFSIWGVIYTLLLVFTVYQILPKRQDKPFIGRISYYYVISSLANCTWILLWINEHIVLSTVMMFMLLLSLITIYLRLEIGKNASLRERLMVHLPFSVYLGWITVASIGNVAVTLVALNWDGWGISDLSWTLLMIAVTIILTLTVIITKGDFGYSLVVAWALIGIIVKQIDIPSVVIVGGIGLGIILLASIIKAIRR
jgi:benzodiazapine receptor